MRIGDAPSVGRSAVSRRWLRTATTAVNTGRGDRAVAEGQSA